MNIKMQMQNRDIYMTNNDIIILLR